jgi:hypothetical protein
MGGRGFPYCTFINAEGEVVWEQRPSAADAFNAGLASAQKLVALKAELKNKPDDKVLAANVALLDLSGRGQRPKPSMDEIAVHAKVPGVDPELVAKFEGMRKGETIGAAMQKYREDKGAAVYKLYQSKMLPDAGSPSLIGYYRYAAEGALEAGQAADALKLIDLFVESGKGNPRMAERIQKDAESLRARAEEMKGK